MLSYPKLLLWLVTADLLPVYFCRLSRHSGAHNPCCYKACIKQIVWLLSFFKFREFAPKAYLGVMTHLQVLQYISCLSLLSGTTSTSCLPLPRISSLTTKMHQKLWWQAKYTACVWGLPTSSFLFSPVNVIWAFGPLPFWSPESLCQPSLCKWKIYAHTPIYVQSSLLLADILPVRHLSFSSQGLCFQMQTFLDKFWGLLYLS